MDNTKFFKIVIIVLLVINIATIGFILLNRDRPQGPPHGDTASFLTRELEFNTSQQKQFEELKREHHEAIEEIKHRDREMHDKYFSLLHNPGEDSILIRNIADSLGENHKQIELITFYHFKKVRELCDEQQKKKFDEIINDALRMMAPRPPGR